MAAVSGTTPGSASSCGAIWSDELGDLGLDPVDGLGELAQAAQLVAGAPDARGVFAPGQAPGRSAPRPDPRTPEPREGTGPGQTAGRARDRFRTRVRRGFEGGDGGNRTRVRSRVRMASTSVSGPLCLASPSPWPAGSGEASLLRFPRIGGGGPHRVILLADTGDPHRRLRGPMDSGLVCARQRDGSRETSHLWFSRTF